MSIPPVPAAGSVASADGSEPEVVCGDGVSEVCADGPESWEEGREEPLSPEEVFSPPQAVREKTNVMDSRRGNNFFILTIPFFIVSTQGDNAVKNSLIFFLLCWFFSIHARYSRVCTLQGRKFNRF